MKALLLIALLAQSRIASDFELAQMERQLATSRDFAAQLSGRLNLGDIRAARNEPRLARAEYEKALTIAANERLDARRDGNMTRYADATSYAALANAKLGRDAEAFALAEEAIRYAGDSAKTWNLYATAMTALGRRNHAARAARNAVAIAATEDDPLDLAIYRHALASSVDDAEAEALLVAVSEALRSREFDALRKDIARGEQFEIYSTARGSAAAYLSLWNRAHLRLAALYERRGARDKARVQYERVLELRSDDATALTALGRFEEAFEANPFSLTLIRGYRSYLASHEAGEIDDGTTGGKVRKAVVQLHRGQKRAARETLDALLRQFPENATLLALRREADASSAVERFESLTAEERAKLDQEVHVGSATFDDAKTANGQTVFERGVIDGRRFRFSEPIAFAGTFGRNVKLTYRILGITREGDDDVLLLEPLGVQP